MIANNTEHNCGESVCAINSPKSALNSYSTLFIDLSDDDDYDDNLLDCLEQNIDVNDLIGESRDRYIEKKIRDWRKLEYIVDKYCSKRDNNDAIDANDNSVAHVLCSDSTDHSMPIESTSGEQKSAQKNVTQFIGEASGSKQHNASIGDRNNSEEHANTGETSVQISRNSVQTNNKPQCDTKSSAEQNNNHLYPKPVIISPKLLYEKESSSDVEVIAIKSPKKKIIRKKFDAHIRSGNMGNRRDLILLEQSNINKDKTKKKRKKLKKLKSNEQLTRTDNRTDDICASGDNKQVLADPRQKSTANTEANCIYRHHFISNKKVESNTTPLADNNRLCASNCGAVLRDAAKSRYCNEHCIRLCVKKGLIMLGIAEQSSERGLKKVAVVEKRHDAIAAIEYIAEKDVLPFIVLHPNYEVFVPEYVKNRVNTSKAESDARSNPSTSSYTRTVASSVANYATKVSVTEQSARNVVTENVSSKKVAEKTVVARKCEKRVRSVDCSRKSSTELRCEQQPRIMPKKVVIESDEQIRFNVKKTIVETLLNRCNEAKDVSVGKYRIECIAEEVEQELYSLYNKSTSQPYKHKYRSLMFNLRDSKNNHLFRQVVNREISSECLVKMSAEEMASKELANWREREKLASLELMTAEAKYFHEKAESKQKKTGLDLNVDINANVEEIGLFSNISGFQLVVNGSYLKSSILTTNLEPEAPKSAPKTVNVQHEAVDKILEENAKQTIYCVYSDAGADELPTEPPPNQPPNKARVYRPPLHTLWQGLIVHESAKFSVNANKLSGATVDFLQDELTDQLVVCGRVAPEIVYDYVKEIVVCPNNEICVVMLDWNVEEKLSYDAFFNYFYHRGRYAVAKCTSYLVKNFYIIPVPRNGYVPNVFLLFNKPDLNNRFLEFIRSTQANVLVGIIITNLPNIQPSYTPPLNPPAVPPALPNHAHPPQPLLSPRPTVPSMPSVIKAIPATNSVSNADPRALRNDNYAAVPMDIDDDIEIIANGYKNTDGNKANAAQSVSSFKDPRLKRNL